ncbi:MAG TPA: PRC-barrel domain-containing protein [Gemmatimonadaceae bacterium]|nr:PRC-barrel domain-containing protein [Gemmatimonadaceae bacterium]
MPVVGPNRMEDQMARDYETEDGVRIAPLGALRDFEVAEGYPDIRGWRVESADGREVGKVHELLIDIDNMRTRYLDVRLASAIAATPGDRDVLVPIGTAQVADGSEVVRVPLTAERVGLLPMYDHGRLTRTHELEVRRHFSLGEAAAASLGATGAAAAAGSAPARGFYDEDAYDDHRFFSAQRHPRSTEVTENVADARRDIRMRDDEIRVPVERDDSVVLKRGEGGRDEIIIRRPVSDRDDHGR